MIVLVKRQIYVKGLCLKSRERRSNLASRQWRGLARGSGAQVRTRADWPRGLASPATGTDRRTRPARRLARRFTVSRWSGAVECGRFRILLASAAHLSFIRPCGSGWLCAAVPSLNGSGPAFVRRSFRPRRRPARLPPRSRQSRPAECRFTGWRREMRRRTAASTAPTRRDARSAI